MFLSFLQSLKVPLFSTMTSNRRSAILLTLILFQRMFCIGHAIVLPPLDPKLNDLQTWGEEEMLRAPVSQSVLCDHYLKGPDCEERSDVYRRDSNKCTYSVLVRSKIFPEEELEMCAHPRPSLPCMMNGNVACEVPPMEVSKFDLMILYLINHELKARIFRLQDQQESGRRLSLDLQREIEMMIADNVAWMCSRKCDNSSCDFNAELKLHSLKMGGIPRMTSLITEYPIFSRSSRLQHIQIDLPIGSFELSRLLKKKAPFRHLAVDSLPLTVSCIKNGDYGLPKTP